MTARRAAPVSMLVPVDGSKNALRALDYVIGLAGLAPMSVDLLYVHVVPPFYSNADAYRRRPENRRYVEKCAKAALDPGIRRLAAAGVQYRSKVVLGDVAPEIVRAGRQAGSTSIVMGSRGLGALGNLVLGSTASKVIHLATVPVTVVK